MVLFACLFLPAVKGCDAPVYPVQTPMFLPPYLYGLAFSLAAMTITVRGMRHAIRGLRAVTFAALACSAVTLLLAPPIGVALLFASVTMLAILGWSGHSERRAAFTALAVSVLCTLWFGLWSATEEAMIGVYLATLGSAGLVAGSLVWIADMSASR